MRDDGRRRLTVAARRKAPVLRLFSMARPGKSSWSVVCARLIVAQQRT